MARGVVVLVLVAACATSPAPAPAPAPPRAPAPAPVASVEPAVTADAPPPPPPSPPPPRGADFIIPVDYYDAPLIKVPELAPDAPLVLPEVTNAVQALRRDMHRCGRKGGKVDVLIAFDPASGAARLLDMHRSEEITDAVAQCVVGKALTLKMRAYGAPEKWVALQVWLDRSEAPPPPPGPASDEDRIKIEFYARKAQAKCQAIHQNLSHMPGGGAVAEVRIAKSGVVTTRLAYKPDGVAPAALSCFLASFTATRLDVHPTDTVFYSKMLFHPKTP